jgi:hypothetical protein
VIVFSCYESIYRPAKYCNYIFYIQNMTLPTSGAISLNDASIEMGFPSGTTQPLVSVYTQRLTGKTNPVLPIDFYGKGRIKMFWDANGTTALTINETDNTLARGVIQALDGHPTQDPNLYPLYYQIVVLPANGVENDFTMSYGAAYSIVNIQFNSPSELTQYFEFSALADGLTEGTENFTVYLNSIIAADGTTVLRNRSQLTATGNQTTLSLTVLDTSASVNITYTLYNGNNDYNLNCLDYCEYVGPSYGWANDSNHAKVNLTVYIFGVLGSIDPIYAAFCTCNPSIDPKTGNRSGRTWAKTPKITVQVGSTGVITGAGGSPYQSAANSGLGGSPKNGGGAMIIMDATTLYNYGVIQGGGAAGNAGNNGICGGGAGYYAGVGLSGGRGPGPANGITFSGGSRQYDGGTTGNPDGGQGGGWVAVSSYSDSTNGYGGNSGRGQGGGTWTGATPGYSIISSSNLQAGSILGLCRGINGDGIDQGGASYRFTRNYSDGSVTS